MQYTTPLLFALAASASATTLPRSSDMGSWNVTLTKSSYANGYTSQSVNAIFVSESYHSPGLITNCKTEYNPNAEPKESSSCEPSANGFSYEYDGASKSASSFRTRIQTREARANETTAIKVQQNLAKPDPMTVFGDAPLELKVDDSVGRSFKGNAIFDVSSAIA
jgi:hypothetical protein